MYMHIKRYVMCVFCIPITYTIIIFVIHIFIQRLDENHVDKNSIDSA